MFSLNTKSMESMFRVLSAVTAEDHEKCMDLNWERKTNPEGNPLDDVAEEFNANLHRINVATEAMQENALAFFFTFGNDLKAVHDGTFEYLRNRAVFHSESTALEALEVYLEQNPVVFLHCIDIRCLGGWATNPFVTGVNFTEPMLPHLLDVEMHYKLDGYIATTSLPIRTSKTLSPPAQEEVPEVQAALAESPTSDV